MLLSEIKIVSNVVLLIFHRRYQRDQGRGGKVGGGSISVVNREILCSESSQFDVNMVNKELLVYFKIVLIVSPVRMYIRGILWFSCRYAASAAASASASAAASAAAASAAAASADAASVSAAASATASAAAASSAAASGKKCQNYYRYVIL